MRYLILSDIHGNLEALEAVLEHTRGEYDLIANCGDVVGYGADPNAVTDWCRTTPQVIVAGNHDRACATLANIEWFNESAAAAANWTHERLTSENREWLAALPSGPALVDGFEVVHGSPAGENDYLEDDRDFVEAAESLTAAVAFFGHTHRQGACHVSQNGVTRLSAPMAVLRVGRLWFVNPGSVGQPRDRDRRAAYALYDSESRQLELRRTSYDVAAAQRKISAAGLPQRLATRLAHGW